MIPTNTSQSARKQEQEQEQNEGPDTDDCAGCGLAFDSANARNGHRAWPFESGEREGGGG